MKCIILYYSNTGNTLLACNYLADRLTGVTVDFYNILSQQEPLLDHYDLDHYDLDHYDVVGFATFTKEWEPPEVFLDYIKKIKKQNQKPAFLLTTYGFISGKTLRTLHRHVTEKGFLVMCGHSLNTPENTPPMIHIGLRGAAHPSKRKLAKFRSFIISLDKFLDNIKNNIDIHPQKIHIGILNTILPPFPRGFLKILMGNKKVDKTLCTGCGICKKYCPGSAISLIPEPAFDDNKCCYCWTCYNRCPEKAIYTTRYKGEYQYSGPDERLKEKLRG